MRDKVLRRNPVALPSLDSLPEALITKLAQSSEALARLTPVSPSLVEQAPDQLLSSLVHPLSRPYVELNGQVKTPLRSDREAEALAWLEGRYAPSSISNPLAFTAMLEDLNRYIVGERSGWRIGPIGTAADKRGNSILFPPVAHTRLQLERLREQLDTGARTVPAIFTAAMALAFLTNCHPFRDGNGRVGRILFNYALRRGGMPRGVYVPFSELAGRSEGGYLIALRQGELHGQWDPLLEFVMAMLDVHRVLVERNEAALHVL